MSSQVAGSRWALLLVLMLYSAAVAGNSITPKPRDFTVGDFKFDTDGDGTPGTDADLTNVIKNGAMKYGGSPLMAPLPHLSDENVADIIVFIRSLKQ